MFFQFIRHGRFNAILVVSLSCKRLTMVALNTEVSMIRSNSAAASRNSRRPRVPVSTVNVPYLSKCYKRGYDGRPQTGQQQYSGNDPEAPEHRRLRRKNDQSGACGYPQDKQY